MAKKRRKKRRNRQMFCISLVVLTMCGIILFNSAQLKQKINLYETQEAELQAQIEDEEAYKEELVKESEYVKTDEYIESVARGKLGLIKEGEIIFKKDEK